MYAVIETGGKQYRVATGDVIEVEKCPGDAGEVIAFPSIRLFRNDQGTVLTKEGLGQARVVGEILKQGRERKTLIFKKKRRKNYRRTRGHRQQITQLRIVSIEGAGG